MKSASYINFTTTTTILETEQLFGSISAGQERYKSLAPMYYRGAAAAIVVYDITSADSFQRAKNWVKELQRQGTTNIVIALAGNKVDLEDKRQVESAEAKSYAEDNGLLFMETSAKAATNVNELFVAIARKLPSKETDNNNNVNSDLTPAIIPKPGDQPPERKQKGGCCN